MQLLRLPRVLERTGLKKSSLYLAVSAGQFPAPIKLNTTGRAVAWADADVDAWIQARIEAARKGAA